jgi:hypothetical protein
MMIVLELQAMSRETSIQRDRQGEHVQRVMRIRRRLETEVEVREVVVVSRNESRCGLGIAVPNTASQGRRSHT